MSDSEVLRLAAVKFDQCRTTDPDSEFEEKSDKYNFIVCPSASLIYAVGIATKTATIHELVCTEETLATVFVPLLSHQQLILHKPVTGGTSTPQTSVLQTG